MKPLFAIAILLTVLFAACSEEGTSIPICDCEPDEYCVDDKCIQTNPDVAPAPIEANHEDK